MYFTDLHVQLLSRSILQPGEQLLGQTVTSYMPWWAFGLIRRQHLVLATNQRLVLVEHRFGFLPPDFRLHAVDSMAWGNVQEARVKGLFMKKKLSLRGMGERGPVAFSAAIPNGLFGLLAPMKNNMAGARAIAATHQSQGAPAFGAPQQVPQLQAPFAQPGMPVMNAPGYASAPPPAASPYGAPPAPSPYGAAPAPFAAPTNLPPNAPPNVPGYPPRWS